MQAGSSVGTTFVNFSMVKPTFDRALSLIYCHADHLRHAMPLILRVCRISLVMAMPGVVLNDDCDYWLDRTRFAIGSC